MIPPADPRSFEKAFAAVQKLAADFHAGKSHHLSPAYQESEVRKDFIDKFLTALGWDVNHDLQKNPFQQEVKVERGVSMRGAQRRADYAFYVAPNFRDVRFFVEAKKPFGDIATPDNCFQTIRYGWNAQTPVAVLTNFVQFQILDCRYKPDIATATGQILKKYHYRDYSNSEKFAEIYYLFSRKAVAAGSLEQYAETLPRRRGKAVQQGLFKGGYQSIDEAFLEDLDEYRERLARAFKNKNPELDGETLTEITQRVIDRLVFIRFLEDKLIEPEHLLRNFGDTGTVWQDFIAASRKLDDSCNGTVFKKHAYIDSPEFKVDDNVFGDICETLADVNSPYDFNAIPIHILGSIYERFLGKVITTTGKRAKVEDKPEVRKAGGVYYTPEYIVRYIVENTVGKLIEGKTPAQIAQMRFADIACGSGSFLLGVFDLLLRYHRDWYNAHPAQAKKDGCEFREDGAWHLVLGQRQVILLNNIFGVDIDRQAMDVAQFSLYLKLLEDETTGTAHAYQMELHAKLLPPLDKNIVCGNSLIGTDIRDGQLFERDEEKKLNPMDFEDRFPEIIKRGGFDAIVGNPPYVRQESLGIQKVFLGKQYQVSHPIADLYTYFIERGLSLLRTGGLFGYIVANKWMRANYGAPLRKWLKKTCICEITDFDGLPVFEGATTYPCILLLCKDKPQASFPMTFMRTLEFESLSYYVSQNKYQVSVSDLSDKGWQLVRKETISLLRKLNSKGIRLEDYVKCKIYRGILTGLNEAFVLTADLYQKMIEKNQKSKELLKPFLLGRDISRYSPPCPNHYLICIPSGWTRSRMGDAKDPWTWFHNNHPSIAEHLRPFERSATQRYDKGEYWWELRSCDYYIEFAKPKIMVPAIVRKASYTLDNQLCYSNDKTSIIPTSDLYLLALLNSKTLDFILHSIASTKQGGYFEYKPMYVSQLPIRPIDFSNPTEKSVHSRMVSLVDQMLAAKQHLAVAKSDADKDFYQNKCAGLDRQIDALVYELYALTPDEIRIVEGAAS